MLAAPQFQTMEVPVPTLRLIKPVAEIGAPKKVKLPWPPVEVGCYFFVEKEDPKWSRETHTSTVSKAMFVTTASGVRCLEQSCGNPGFAEARGAEINHSSSLYSCDKHVGAFHPPPTKRAPSVLKFFSPVKRNIPPDTATAADVTETTATATGATDVDECLPFSSSSSSKSLQPTPIATGVVAIGPSILLGSTELSASKCPGFPWAGPKPMVKNYPFQIHAVPYMAKVVTWEPRTSGFLHSNIPSCTGEAVEGGPCVSCAGLLFNTGLGGVIARACNSELHLTSITNEFLTAVEARTMVK